MTVLAGLCQLHVAAAFFHSLFYFFSITSVLVSQESVAHYFNEHILLRTWRKTRQKYYLSLMATTTQCTNKQNLWASSQPLRLPIPKMFKVVKAQVLANKWRTKFYYSLELIFSFYGLDTVSLSSMEEFIKLFHILIYKAVIKPMWAYGTELRGSVIIVSVIRIATMQRCKSQTSGDNVSFFLLLITLESPNLQRAFNIKFLW